ncbi:hypothetical protein J6590_054401 [Homalodisca vitripennis]|nr:hypothetical protein J6590_054401 [Homalodisca vitripennis]
MAVATGTRVAGLWTKLTLDKSRLPCHPKTVLSASPHWLSTRHKGSVLIDHGPALTNCGALGKIQFCPPPAINNSIDLSSHSTQKRRKQNLSHVIFTSRDGDTTTTLRGNKKPSRQHPTIVSSITPTPTRNIDTVEVVPSKVSSIALNPIRNIDTVAVVPSKVSSIALNPIRNIDTVAVVPSEIPTCPHDFPLSKIAPFQISVLQFQPSFLPVESRHHAFTDIKTVRRIVKCSESPFYLPDQVNAGSGKHRDAARSGLIELTSSKSSRSRRTTQLLNGYVTKSAMYAKYGSNLPNQILIKQLLVDREVWPCGNRHLPRRGLLRDTTNAVIHSAQQRGMWDYEISSLFLGDYQELCVYTEFCELYSVDIPYSSPSECGGGAGVLALWEPDTTNAVIHSAQQRGMWDYEISSLFLGDYRELCVYTEFCELYSVDIPYSSPSECGGGAGVLALWEPDTTNAVIHSAQQRGMWDYEISSLFLGNYQKLYVYTEFRELYSVNVPCSSTIECGGGARGLLRVNLIYHGEINVISGGENCNLRPSAMLGEVTSELAVTHIEGNGSCSLFCSSTAIIIEIDSCGWSQSSDPLTSKSTSLGSWYWEGVT